MTVVPSFTPPQEDSEDSDTDVEEETSNPPPARPPLNFTRCSMGTAGSLFEVGGRMVLGWGIGMLVEWGG